MLDDIDIAIPGDCNPLRIPMPSRVHEARVLLPFEDRVVFRRSPVTPEPEEPSH